MADPTMTMLEDVIRRLERVERELREVRNQRQRDVLGSRDRPLRLTYHTDPQTGAVGRLEYDSDANDTRWTKER